MIGFRYYYGGLGVRTQLRIPGLIEVSDWKGTQAARVNSLRVELATSPLAENPQFLHRWQGRFGLALHSLRGDWVFTTKSGAAFHVDKVGGTVTCHLGASGWCEATAEGFVRRVLPHVVQLHGRTVLHAAALDTGRGVVLLCGQSGAGKSTLTASLNQQLGWPILGDDIAVLEECAGSFTVLPSGNSISLWEDSQAALAGAFEHSELVGIYASKYRCQPTASVGARSQPLRAVFQLMPPVAGGEEPITIRTVEPTRAVALLANQVIRFNPADRQAEAARFMTLAQMASSVPVSTLHYSRQFGVLPQLAERLAAALGLVPSPAIAR